MFFIELACISTHGYSGYFLSPSLHFPVHLHDQLSPQGRANVTDERPVSDPSETNQCDLKHF